MMRPGVDATENAGLYVCQSMLLALTENNIIDEAKAKVILQAVASARRKAVSSKGSAGGGHAKLGSLPEPVDAEGDTVQYIDRSARARLIVWN